MRKIMFVLVVWCLVFSCVFGFGFQSQHKLNTNMQVSHVHGQACGHAFVNGVWVVR